MRNLWFVYIVGVLMFGCGDYPPLTQVEISNCERLFSLASKNDFIVIGPNLWTVMDNNRNKDYPKINVDSAFSGIVFSKEYGLCKDMPQLIQQSDPKWRDYAVEFMKQSIERPGSPFF